MKFAVIGVVFLCGVGALLWISIAQASIKNYTVTEVLSPDYGGEECRVDNGKLVRVINKADPLKFVIRDKKDPNVLMTVISDRHPPDNLRYDNDVGLRGTFDRSTGMFRAEEVTTKCPSKYQGEAKTPSTQDRTAVGSETAPTPVQQ